MTALAALLLLRPVGATIVGHLEAGPGSSDRFGPRLRYQTSHSRRPPNARMTTVRMTIMMMEDESDDEFPTGSETMRPNGSVRTGGCTERTANWLPTGSRMLCRRAGPSCSMLWRRVSTRLAIVGLVEVMLEVTTTEPAAIKSEISLAPTPRKTPRLARKRACLA